MKWLARFAAQTAVRRVVYVVVGLLLAAVGIGKAEAGNPITVCGKQYAYGGAPTSDTHQGLEQAAAHCATEPTQYIEIAGQTHHLIYEQSQGCTVVGSTIRKRYARGPKRLDANTCQIYNDGPNDGYQATAMTHGFTDQCPAGTTWNPTTATCHSPEKCLAKPALSAGMFTTSGSGTTCVDGCQFAAPVSVCTTAGAQSMCSVGGATPTGQACAAGEAPPSSSTPKNQECLPVNGQTVCLRKDGKYCATASSGKQFCWEPGQTGEQTDGADKQRRDPGNTPQPPNPAPSGDTLVQSGQPATTTTTVKDQSGTRTITSTTTNYVTQNGTDAGAGPGTGQPADGSGSGSGSGDGSGDGDGTGTAVGGFGEGELYGKTDKTIESVYGTFKAEMMGSEFGQAMAGFIGSCQGGGACPSATWEAATWGIAVSLAELCAGTLSNLLAFAGWVFLAGIAWFSYKVALL